jgi:hypothetical protein
MKTIRLLKDVVGANEEPFKEGSFQTLNDASADHWLKRGLAVEVSEQEVTKESSTLTLPRKKNKEKA